MKLKKIIELFKNYIKNDNTTQYNTIHHIHILFTTKLVLYNIAIQFKNKIIQ